MIYFFYGREAVCRLNIISFISEVGYEINLYLFRIISILELKLSILSCNSIHLEIIPYRTYFKASFSFPFQCLSYLKGVSGTVNYYQSLSTLPFICNDMTNSKMVRLKVFLHK